MYALDGIVLNKRKVRDNEFLLSVFSRQYGKISVWNRPGRKDSGADIGSVCNFSLSNGNSINKAESIKTKRIIDTQYLDYAGICNILDICALIDCIMPHGAAFESVYDDLVLAFSYLESRESNAKIHAFLKLKTLKKLGIAKTPSGHENLNVLKIFGALDRYPLESMVRISGVRGEDIRDIRNMSEDILHIYLN